MMGPGLQVGGNSEEGEMKFGCWNKHRVQPLSSKGCFVNKLASLTSVRFRDENRHAHEPSLNMSNRKYSIGI